VQDNEQLAQTRIGIPALAIGGGGHGGMGQYQVDQMQRYATDLTGLVLPGFGHWLPEECAAPPNSAVTGFLQAR